MMKLCRLKQGKNTLSSVRRAKRFAFAIALAGITNSAVLAQTTLPKLPEPLTAESPQLPKLVFGKTDAQQKAIPQLESRLVGILGLAAIKCTPAQTCEKSDVETVCNVESSGSKTPVSSPNCTTMVVLASATEQSTSSDAGETSAAEEESLFDFEMQIPGIPEGKAAQTELPRTAQSRSESTTIPSEPTVRTMPNVARKGRVMRLSIDPPAVAPPTPLPVEYVDSKEQTVKKSVAIEPTDDQENDRTEFRFSDAIDMPAESKVPESVVSSRNTPEPKPATVVSRAGRMRVRIEGEPSVVVPSQHLNTDDQNIHLAGVPKPTFQIQDEARPALAINKSARVAPQKTESSLGKKLPALSDQDISTGESLVIGRQESSSIATDLRILQYSTEHASVCRLIKTGEKTLSLIGLTQGESRIAIVTIDDSGKRRVEVRDVRVAEGSAAQVDLQALSREITQTISKLYPKSKIEIVSDGEQLIVQGTVRSERDARKVVSLVRKTALTPVVDRIQSFPNH